MAVRTFLAETYLGSTAGQYLLFFAIAGVGAVLGKSLGYLYRRHLRRKADATETEIDDIVVYALGAPAVLLGVVVGLAAGQVVLTPVEPLASILRVSLRISVLVLLAWIVVRLTDGLIATYLGSYAEHTDSKLDEALVPIVSRITNIAVVSIALLVVLDSMGYDVNAIIASLGIGGIAVAFASRKTLADVFGGAHILTAKPFLVGDLVAVDGTEGRVEEIGLRCTRIRDADGRVITVPNSNIAETEVKNITSEPTRRVTTVIGLDADTSPTELETALELIRETTSAVDGVDPGETEAWFWEYGDAAMRIRLEYHVEALDRWKDVKHAVNRDLQAAFEDAGIVVAR